MQIGIHQIDNLLYLDGLIGGWAHALGKAMALYDRLGAHPTRIVEAGLVGVRGVYWPGHFTHDSPPARKDRCIHRVQQRDWSEEAQMNFLTDAYNKIRDLFALPRASADDTGKLIGQ